MELTKEAIEYIKRRSFENADAYVHLASDGAVPEDYPNFKSKGLFVLDPWETALDGKEEISDPQKEYGWEQIDLFCANIIKQTGDISVNILNHPEAPEGWLYIGDTKKARYVLGQPGNYNLIVIGLNPSTATPLCPDPTIARIKKIVEQENYDGWIMINLYPKRETDPDRLPKNKNKLLAECNQVIIELLCRSYNIAAVYAAWGTNIEKHNYLLDECQSLVDIIRVDNWFTRGVTKYGHPKHPLYVPYEQKKDWFPVQDYIWNMKR